MAIPSVDRGQILDALAKFDRDEKLSPDWQGWEQRASFKFALVQDGKTYPVKEIIALATGAPVGTFSGGKEANGYVSKLGFAIERLHLPPESELKAALHDLLLEKHPIAVEPAEAYEVLATTFALSERLRNKPMENTDENQWQNRVRQSRRKLVDDGIIDASEIGQWKLKVRSQRRVWVEKCLIKGRADRFEGENALGKALWSPLRGKNGADIYRSMRLVQPNDVILHLTDNLAFTGTSIVSDLAETDFVGLPNTDWAGQDCYRVRLRDFTKVDPPLTKEELVSDREIRNRLVAIRGRNSNLFYDPDLDLHQGGYLTEAPEELVDLLGSLYEIRAKKRLPNLPVMAIPSTTEPTIISESIPEPPVLSRRIWLYAPGRSAIYWNEFRQLGIAGIGEDAVGDLKELQSPEVIKAKMDQVYPEPQSLVNATQCFDFAHRMAPGDWIFAKKGRREIIGFGIVRSDYRFDLGRASYQHVRNVDWQKAGRWPTGPTRMLSMKTLTEITEDEALLDELEELMGITDTETPSVVVNARAPVYTAADFSVESAIPQETIELWEARLRRKKHIIFQGPPGTGKTYVADRLARLLISDTFGISETVQFHPSYGYEDFMHGIRPVVLDGQLLFQPTPGRFLKFCRAARQISDGSPCVLIVDEINRGNLSRIFGELMYLLEYRDKSIALAGQDQPFGIPENVFLIGTMNTADRSIALVDHALRRRFSFIHLAPDYEVLRSQLDSCGLASDGLLEALQAVNAAIDDPHYEIGISYFLKDGAQLRATLKDIWQGEIEPYLEEYFYDQPSKLEPLSWTKLEDGLLKAWKKDT